MVDTMIEEIKKEYVKSGGITNIPLYLASKTMALHYFEWVTKSNTDF